VTRLHVRVTLTPAAGHGAPFGGPVPEGSSPRDETQQQSVRLAYYGGLTYREVAEKLNAAVPTIKSRIRDGLIRLKTCLGVS
jgi:DNA-binding NarL/FixJ family response regulator